MSFSPSLQKFENTIRTRGWETRHTFNTSHGTKTTQVFLIDLDLVLFFSSLVFRQVYEDNDHGLYTVTLFKKVVDEFKLHARDKKYNSLVDD